MKKWLMSVLLITFSICSFSSFVLADASVDLREEQINVAPDKEWTITFNTPVMEETVTYENVYVLDKSTGNYADIKLDVVEDGTKLIVKPTTNYPVDNSYVLHISSDVKSVQGELPMTQAVELPFSVSKEYQIVEMLSTPADWNLGTSYDSLDEAVDAASTDGTEAIIRNGTMVWAPVEGTQLFSKGFTNLFKDESLSSDPKNSYVNGNQEMMYLESTEDAVKVNVAGQEYYISHNNASFVTEPFYEGKSYYENVGGDLYHRLYLNGIRASYNYGAAPENMEEGEQVESLDGNTFKGEKFLFFNDLDLRKTSHYNADQLDQYLEEAYPEYLDKENRLVGLGEAFIKAEEEYEVNALYLMAHAIHESAWGTSAIARDKNNLFGYKAYDGSAYDSAATFETMEEGISFIAEEVLDNGYLKEGTFRYNGAYLGDKSGGMNIKYASDPFWGQKIAGYIYRADKFLGGYDAQLLEEDYEAVKFPTVDEEEEEDGEEEESQDDGSGDNSDDENAEEDAPAEDDTEETVVEETK
ncbi:glucosaminidase domain-containing protein [Halobacillus litoralis]|uniref:N-acetylglucosaminidase n=1 Tax=Halobacillus litoralis TaxID=45668 RepID=UPI001CD41A7F|nr:glucosaminidase domain-containing protein [Halobacillus litoralis]MCA0971555.1 glucosaminidase domain-containing protein [Halobacillus litoralis]